MNISSNYIRESVKLLSRIRHPRATLPVLTHVLATLDATGITLAITDLDRWLETRIITCQTIRRNSRCAVDLLC